MRPSTRLYLLYIGKFATSEFVITANVPKICQKIYQELYNTFRYIRVRTKHFTFLFDPAFRDTYHLKQK